MPSVVAVVEQVLLIGREAVGLKLPIQKPKASTLLRVWEAQCCSNGFGKLLSFLQHVIAVELQSMLEIGVYVLLDDLHKPV